MSRPTVRIAHLLMERPDSPRHAYGIGKTLNMTGAEAKAVLARMERKGLLTSEWMPGHGPARKVYAVTGDGRAFFAKFLERADQHPRYGPMLAAARQLRRTAV